MIVPTCPLLDFSISIQTFFYLKTNKKSLPVISTTSLLPWERNPPKDLSVYTELSSHLQFFPLNLLFYVFTSISINMLLPSHRCLQHLLNPMVRCSLYLPIHSKILVTLFYYPFSFSFAGSFAFLWFPNVKLPRSLPLIVFSFYQYSFYFWSHPASVILILLYIIWFQNVYVLTQLSSMDTSPITYYLARPLINV